MTAKQSRTPAMIDKAIADRKLREAAILALFAKWAFVPESARILNRLKRQFAGFITTPEQIELMELLTGDKQMHQVGSNAGRRFRRISEQRRHRTG